MAQIITYPKLSTLANNDLLLVSDVSSPNKTTNSLEVDTLAQHIIVTNNVITGGGTLRQIPMFTPTGVIIGDSIMNQNHLDNKIEIHGTLSLEVTNRIINVADPVDTQDAATKNYVDSQIGTNDTLEEILANGNTTGGTDIAVSAGDNITFTDTSKVILGDSQDLEIYHNGQDAYIHNNTGILRIENDDTNQDILFQAKGAVTLEEYIRIDGSDSLTKFSKDTQHKDNVKAFFGTGNDLQIYHDGTNASIRNNTGDILISALEADSDIKFFTDNGVGTTVSNLEISGSTGTVSLKHYGSQKLYTATNGIKVTDNADISGQVQVGTNNTTLGENILRFQTSGDAFVEHNTIGQSLYLRTSNAASLDTNAIIIAPDGDIDLSGSLTVLGTGQNSFAGQVTIPATPIASTDAASKAYVDAGNTGQVTGTGTTQTLPVWSDGPAGVLSDSAVRQSLDIAGNVNSVKIELPTGATGIPANDYFFGLRSFSSNSFDFKSGGLSGGYYGSGDFKFHGDLAVGRTSMGIVTLDVGDPTDTQPAAWFRNGVVISNNPSGVQVDNTSLVIGAGNNDNISGSDHCLIVGSNNQITSNSDQSVAFGQGNTITSSTDSLAVGNSNTINSAQRVYALGFNNNISSASSFVAGGDNTVSSGNTKIVLGYDNSSTGSNTFVIGNELTGADTTMVLGYRNRAAFYPTPDKNLGLGDTKFVVAVGSGLTTPADNNAIIITEGGINGGNTGLVPQVPRIVLPTIVNFNFADDTAAAAGGIPVGGLYHNAGALRIRLV